MKRMFLNAMAALAVLLAATGCGGNPGADAADPSRMVAATVAPFTGHGTWWNPAEPGTGFVFEAQNNIGVVTVFVYEDDGRPVWYSAVGPMTVNATGGYTFSATLLRFRGGQNAQSTVVTTPTATSVGAIAIDFDGEVANVRFPARSFVARKLAPAGTTPPAGIQPEAGIYWNPQQSGRGFTMDVINGIVWIGVYHYDSNGEPTWNLITAPMAGGSLAASFGSFRGGQTLAGAYRPAQSVTTTQTFTATFSAACTGEIRFPGMPSIAVQRFNFGSLPGGTECRALLATTPTPSTPTPTPTTTIPTTPTTTLPTPTTTVPTPTTTVPTTPTTTTSTTPTTPPVTSTLVVCAPGVTGGFAKNFETTPANAGIDYSTGAGGGGGDGGGAGAGGGLGKVLGGLIRVTDLSNGAVIGEAITDATSGLVTVRTCTRPGPFQITLEGRAGALYFDEGINDYMDFGPGNVFHAIVDRWDEHVGVSPLTEAAYRYALHTFKANTLVGISSVGGSAPGGLVAAAGRHAAAASTSAAAAAVSAQVGGSLVGLTAEQVRTANARVAAEINTRLTQKYQLASVNTLPTPIDRNSSAQALPNTKHGISAAVVGGLVRASRDYNAALSHPALQLTEQVARDMTDGRIDGFDRSAREAAAATAAAYESTRLPIGAQVGVHAISTRFGAAVTPAELQVNERMFFGTDNNPWTCDQFADDVALLSDGSVTVLRRTAANRNGSCAAFDYNAETKQRNFLVGVRQILAARYFGLAVMNDGTVMGWGSNTCGAMGGRLAPGIHKTPQRIAGLTDITSIASSTNVFGTKVLARDKTGRVYQLGLARTSAAAGPNEATCVQPYGNGTLTSANFVDPELITGLSNVLKVFAGNSTYLALLADGRVMGWGSSNVGVLGNGTTSPSGQVTFPNTEVPASAPVEVPGLTGTRDLAIYYFNYLALMKDGTVKWWGFGGSAGLLDKSIASPTTHPGISDAVELVADDESNRIRILRSDGKVYVWGRDGLPDSTTPPIPLRLETPVEPIRTITLKNSVTNFFRSGRISFSHTGTDDQNARYR